MKNIQLFDFCFFSNCLKAFKAIGKFCEQVLWMALICVIVTIVAILAVSVHLLMLENWMFVRSLWKLLKVYFKKENRAEIVKMLLQNNCINNGVTNGLKQQKQIACETALYGKIKERRERRRVDD